MNIWFATNNTHKKDELAACLLASNSNIKLKIPSEEGLKFNPDETGSTFIDNALIKARELHKLVGNSDLVISDDSGLCVDALNGRPGVISAIYGMENGQKITSSQQNSLLLDELGENPVRTARFVCSMVLLFSFDRFIIVQETLEGEIVKRNQIKGDGGFGYDPIFYVPHLNRTLAELTTDEKNSLSHRGKAGIQIANYIKNNAKI